MRIGYFTPTRDYQIDLRNRGASWGDVRWAVESGHEVTDVNALVAASSSVELQRNVALERAISHGCQRLLMVDSDVWADDALSQLMATMDEHEAVIAGALVGVRGGKDGKLNADPATPGECYRASWVSAACALIDLRELTLLPRKYRVPWFKRVHNESWTHSLVDEGAWFCRVVSDLGGIVVVNGKVRTHHRDSFTRTAGG